MNWSKEQLEALKQMKYSSQEAKKNNKKLILIINENLFPQEISTEDILLAANIDIKDVAFNYKA